MTSFFDVFSRAAYIASSIVVMGFVSVNSVGLVIDGCYKVFFCLFYLV
ncbi:MAG: hypothetical protein ACJA0N_002577 [Pseudohongiellaceae bacterium]|jgi:hypothetical protein